MTGVEVDGKISGDGCGRGDEGGLWKGNDTNCNWFLHLTLWCLSRGEAIMIEGAARSAVDISTLSFLEIVSSFLRC